MENLSTLTEEKLKNKIRDLFFKDFDYFGDKIDFCITQNLEILGDINLLWAEAKNGTDACIYESFIQLILTIGKHRYNTQQTPKFLGAFDAEKFAFLPYSSIQEIFYQNDINWSVTPSDHKSEQFQALLIQLKPTLEKDSFIFHYSSKSKELTSFIANNLTTNEINKIEIDKNNFVSVYFKWLEVVKGTISIDWALAKKAGIIDADFYLADLLSQENVTITDKLYAVLKSTHYEFNKKITFLGTQSNEIASFKDNQKLHKQFWNIYKRPPRKEFWDYIIGRRDLLVDQDIRERKGAFFTPKVWVAKSQEYLAKALGENWQEEYYIWDCAGGTGNLLAGLSNPRNIFLSTLDQADVDINKERIKNGADLLENHIFQFDFLNDEFFDTYDEKGKIIKESKLPKALQEILKSEQKRSKLVIYINPPYAEATSSKTKVGIDNHKPLVATETMIYDKYLGEVGKANRELFVQFFIRIYKEIDGCILASFSTLKYVNSQNFIQFRKTFQAKFLGGFIAPADTFDNVKGKFPIGFLIWNTGIKKSIKKINLDIFDEQQQNVKFFGVKYFYSAASKNIKDWLREHNTNLSSRKLGHLVRGSADFQNNNVVFMTLSPSQSVIKASNENSIFENTLIINAIFLAVRHAIPATWINDRDQFLYPNDLWEKDKEFQNDCLAFTLFHGQNKITGTEGTNHFIPFTEKEIMAKGAFQSCFMSDFLKGKVTHSSSLLDQKNKKGEKLEFSDEAKAVFEAGKALFAYYHAQDFSLKPYNVDASLYDIKEFFQGRKIEIDKDGNEIKGKMNPPSKAEDSHYKTLLSDLNTALSTLATKIQPKIYEYGFLRE